MLIRFSSFVFLFCLAVSGFAQSSTPGGSVRLTVLSGSNIDFVFNSLPKYAAGIVLSDWTVLGISVTDNAGDLNAPPAVDDYTTWRLYAEALDSDGDGFITGAGPPLTANQLPFSTIEMFVSAVSPGCVSCANLYPAPPGLALPAPGMGSATPLVDGSAPTGEPVPADQIEDVPSIENLDYTTARITISYQCGVTVPLMGSPADYYTDDIVFTLEMNP